MPKDKDLQNIDNYYADMNKLNDKVDKAHNNLLQSIMKVQDFMLYKEIMDKLSKYCDARHEMTQLYINNPTSWAERKAKENGN